MAILGRSAGGTRIYEVLLSVFGLWRIDERRRLARARYAFVFSQTQRRPWRKSIFAELQARVGRDPHFRKQSVTGAIGAALKKLGLEWPGAASVDSDDGSGTSETKIFPNFSPSTSCSYASFLHCVVSLKCVQLLFSRSCVISKRSQSSSVMGRSFTKGLVVSQLVISETSTCTIAFVGSLEVRTNGPSTT